jgi:hypothetical protein
VRASDLQGRQFGRLTAIRPVYVDGVRLWECQCSCGAVVQRKANTLGYHGRVSSCGCLLKERFDPVGRWFGQLLVIRKEERQERTRRWLWRCRCECGTEILSGPSHLLDGSRTDCGCGRGERYRRYGLAHVRANNKTLWRRQFAMYRGNARHKGLAFELTAQQFRQVCSEPCAYCGTPPVRVIRLKGKFGTLDRLAVNGIDRVDNRLGYVTDNIVPCCSECNYMKRDRTREDFIAKVKRVARHLSRSERAAEATAQQVLLL